MLHFNFRVRASLAHHALDDDVAARGICYSYICDVGTINDTKAVGDDFILTKSN